MEVGSFKCVYIFCYTDYFIDLLKFLRFIVVVFIFMNLYVLQYILLCYVICNFLRRVTIIR